MPTLRKQVSDALRARGFRRHGGDHLQRIQGDFSFWVGTGPIGWQLDIAPFAGIRCDRVETLMTELMGLPPAKFHPTAGANIGYLLGGEYLAWQPDASVAEILSSIDTALERLRPFADLAALARLFDMPEVAALPHRWHALVAMALLRTDGAEAYRLLAQGGRELCAKADEICSDFRAFEHRALERLKAERA